MVMSHRSRAELVVIVGWLLVVVFGVLVWLVAGELRSGLIFAVVGLAMSTWVARRPGTAALAVSLVLGLLHTAEQIAYFGADVSRSNPPPLGSVLGDAEGLLGGLLVVGGAVVGLRRLRRSRAVAEPVA
jgi:hypothetical protein